MSEDALKFFEQNCDHFKILLDKSCDVFWITDLEYTNQIYVSPAFEHIWGYKTSVLYKNPLFWLDTLLEEDKHQLAAISRLPHSCVMIPYQEKYRIKTANGEQRWILDHTYPVLNNIGQCVGYAGIAQDITNDLKKENDLNIANKFLPKLAEKMEHVAFWVADSTFKKYLYLSKGFEKIWGSPVEPFIMQPEKLLATVIIEDRQRDPIAMLEIVNEKGEAARFSDVYRIARPSGEVRWIRDVSFPIFDEGKVCVGFAGIAEDITQEKLYEIELQQAKERAEAANIAKSNFIASMSHDFRTPLNGLLGMAEILQSGRCYPEQKEHINAILQAGSTLLDLVEDIINYAALDLNKLPIQLEWFDLQNLLQEIILTLSPQAHQKKVEIILSYSEQIPKEVFGDIKRIRRILMNLINNAVKFTSDGHVLINIEIQKTLDRKFSIQFTIEDTGIGISKEHFDYIFGSFNRIEPPYRGCYKGTGLGLTIAKQFIADLNGTIQLKSELNQGTIFYCSLPFENPKKKVKTSTQIHFTQRNTLVIDDYSRRGETFIKQFGFKNARTVSGDQALLVVDDALKKHNPFDFILIADDIQEDIFELAEEIRKHTNAILLLITDSDAQITLDSLRSFGIDDYIGKPVKPIVVAQSLDNASLMLNTPFDKRHGQEFESTSRNVLLVEDDLLTQKITSWMLEELNWKVEIASTGKQALDLLEMKYDLVILDIGLPDMDGISLADRIRKGRSSNRSTPIVALTAHVMETDREKCLAAGMNEFLKKPLFKKDLKSLLFKLFISNSS